MHGLPCTARRHMAMTPWPPVTYFNATSVLTGTRPSITLLVETPRPQLLGGGIHLHPPPPSPAPIAPYTWRARQSYPRSSDFTRNSTSAASRVPSGPSHYPRRSMSSRAADTDSNRRRTCQRTQIPADRTIVRSSTPSFHRHDTEAMAKIQVLPGAYAPAACATGRCRMHAHTHVRTHTYRHILPH